MVSHRVAIEVQRNAKWGSPVWKKRAGEVGRRKWIRWEKRVCDVEKESE